MAIFRDPVTSLQYFGYSIALAGLTYYKLGGKPFQHAVTEARLSLAGFRRHHPARAKAGVLCLLLGALSLFLLLWWPAIPEKYKTATFG